jgi:hypothetical protein
MQICSFYRFGIWAVDYKKKYHFRSEMQTTRPTSSIEAQKAALKIVARNQGFKMQNGSKRGH